MMLFFFRAMRYYANLTLRLVLIGTPPLLHFRLFDLKYDTAKTPAYATKRAISHSYPNRHILTRGKTQSFNRKAISE
jgi:hypothetical protein